MSELRALRERVEMAESGYPQLDLMIWNTLNKTGETWAWLNNVDGDERIVCDKMAEGSIFRPVCSVDRFSRCIEDAVELIKAKLPDAGWSCGQPHPPYKAEANIYGPAKPWPESTRLEYAFHAKAATPALALIAALLNALENANG